MAVKIIRPDRLSPGVLRRFRHEAEILGTLQHPGIAQVYEAGTADVEVAGGGSVEQPFLALELVRGVPLREHVDAHGLGVEARLELVARICDAIQHAHLRGVIHRDLKPANVLVVEEETGSSRIDAAPLGVGQPKVLDFGIARFVDPGLDVVTSSGETRSGDIVGTLSYMSPERLESGSVDVRSDVWALGVMLYELLASRRPFDLTGASMAEAVRRIANDEPTALGEADPTLRGDVAVIAAKALEKDPERRYQSAADLAADLRRYVNDEPIEARADSALYLLRRRFRRHRALLVTALVFLALSTGFAIAFGFQARENSVLAQAESTARQRSDADFERALSAIDLVSEVAQNELGNLPLAEGTRRRLLEAVLGFQRSLLEDYGDTPTLALRTVRARQNVGGHPRPPRAARRGGQRATPGTRRATRPRRGRLGVRSPADRDLVDVDHGPRTHGRT